MGRTAEVIEILHTRAEAGLKKYGVTMDRDDLSLTEWATHAQEEMLDAAQYLQVIKESGNALNEAARLLKLSSAVIDNPEIKNWLDKHKGLYGHI